jgi:hypothetical protein
MSYEPDATDEQRRRRLPAEDELRASGSGGMSERVGARAEQARTTAAGGLDRAAGTLDEQAASLPGGARVASAAHSAANALSSSADYIREHDLGDMMEDLRDVVKNNPGPALLGAAALGFLIGRAFSRD